MEHLTASQGDISNLKIVNCPECLETFHHSMQMEGDFHLTWPSLHIGMGSNPLVQVSEDVVPLRYPLPI